MNENNSQTGINPPVADTDTKTSALPPIKTLFTDSYNLLKQVLAPFIIFNIIVFVATIIALALIVIGFILLGVGAGFGELFTENFLTTLGVGVLASFSIIIVVLIIVSSVTQIGSTIILYEANPKIRVVNVIKRSARYIIPLFLIGLVSGFLVVGGYFLLIIPGIIITIFTSLTFFSVVIENKTPISAIKRSIFLVKNNFSGFFLRVLALWGVMILIFIVLSIVFGILGGINENLSGVIAILNSIAQILVSWYTIAYMVVLFKQLQKASPTGEGSLKLILIISIIGWIVAIFMGYFLFRTVGSFIAENQNNGGFEQELTPEEEEIERIFQEIDSEFNSEELERYMEEIEGTTTPDIETSTPPANTI